MFQSIVQLKLFFPSLTASIDPAIASTACPIKATAHLKRNDFSGLSMWGHFIVWQKLGRCVHQRSNDTLTFLSQLCNHHPTKSTMQLQQCYIIMQYVSALFVSPQIESFNTHFLPGKQSRTYVLWTESENRWVSKYKVYCENKWCPYNWGSSVVSRYDSVHLLFIKSANWWLVQQKCLLRKHHVQKEFIFHKK